ncbi:hypothetical protein [Caulobacter sp. S45]|uniref:hypothetical protein n=1 Tax=Caulobacter sp. S45 TaxID=1641861 RepID=UPI001576086C|nr:hypothetical protein [Caulobacter sp. S45]
MNATVRLVDRMLVDALEAEVEWLRTDNGRLALSRRRWRRFAWALITVWGALVALSFIASPAADPCLRGRPLPAYPHPIHQGVRGAPWPAHV